MIVKKWIVCDSSLYAHIRDFINIFFRHLIMYINFEDQFNFFGIKTYICRAE